MDRRILDIGAFLVLLIWALSSCAGRASEQVQLPAGLPDRLSGRLVLLTGEAERNRLVQLDLETGKLNTIYRAPKGGWLGGAAVSPDGKQVVIAYKAPGEVSNSSSLYTLPEDGSSRPKILLAKKLDIETYRDPTWSPDGRSIYYTHIFQDETGNHYRVERLAADGTGQPETVIEPGEWPALSPNGARLAYLAPEKEGENIHFYQAGTGEKAIQPLLAPGQFEAVDEHLYTPDGKSILFSAVNPAETTASPAPRSWLERLIGVQVVEAHEDPSDLYLLLLDGSAIRRLTRLNDTGFEAAYSPAGDYLAFVSSTGLYMMGTGGENLAKINSPYTFTSISWIP